MSRLVPLLAALAVAFVFALVVTVRIANADTGYASWYGPGFIGNPLGCSHYGSLKTSTWGVAHRTLPCGTSVTVCYHRRCATAPVVDRGPYAAGRVLDLTAAVARYIGLGGVDLVRWWRS